MAALGLTLAVITLVSIRLSSQSTVSANIPPLLPCPLSGAFDYYYNWYEGYGFEQRHLLKWTRDGSGILFHRLMRLYSVEPDGSRLHRIVNGAPDHDFGPEDYFGLYADMSPDNSRIAYSTCFYPMGMDIAKRFGYQFHNYEIETSNIDGTERRRLTENDTFEHFPFGRLMVSVLRSSRTATCPRILGVWVSRRQDCTRWQRTARTYGASRRLSRRICLRPTMASPCTHLHGHPTDDG